MIGDEISEEGNMVSGVPQGSIVGAGYVSAHLDISAPDISAPGLFGARTFFFRFVVL